jgi:hypothetical protein
MDSSVGGSTSNNKGEEKVRNGTYINDKRRSRGKREAENTYGNVP